VVNSYAEFCGWCESYFSQDDLENKRYKTMYKSRSVLGMMQSDNAFKVCMECLQQFSFIRSLKEH